MSFAITFVIPGAPVAKARPRVTRNGTYTPKDTRDYEREVRLLARTAYGMSPPLDEPIHLDLVAYVPIPKSWPKRRQQAARDGVLYPTSRPDLDNYEKAVTDGCNGIVYLDDAQIVEVCKTKRYSDHPHMWVRIASVDSAFEDDDE
ncbi:RusA family crossover junction endodeoxyribonuclease [Burkholderia pseudomallei]